MKVCLILGHPDSQSKCGAFADAFEEGLRRGGHEARRFNLGELNFDPILHKGYKVIQPLEPDLVSIQEAIKWCEFLVIFYPNWFITMPALLKGMFDRIWLPGFAYHFRQSGFGWQKLLSGRSARVFVTMDSSPLLERFFLGDYTNEIKKGLLGFAGFRPVRVTKIGNLKGASAERLAEIRRRMFLFGSKI